MYELYKKTDDRSNNIYGIQNIDKSENPFLNSPCLLTWNAVDNNDKAINGLCKRALRMARLRTTYDDGAGYIADDFPVDFLMMKDDGKDLLDKSIDEFVEKYFIPLISKDNAKIDIIEAQRNMRNVNILPNCDATKLVLRVEEYMLKRMQELGYTQEEMLTVQSQMCVFPVQTEANLSKFKSTTIAFADVNDREVPINIANRSKNEGLKEILARNNKKVLKGNVSKNVKLVFTEGIGTHEVVNYTGESDIAPYVTTIVSNALNNSIHNKLHRDDFIPINIGSLEKGTEQITLEIENGKTIEEVVNQLDENLEYEGTTRLSKRELKIMAQLDEANKRIMKLEKDLKFESDKSSKLQEELKKTDEAIEKFSSETTKKKILLDTGRYQFWEKEAATILEAPSDKEIAEGNISMKSVVSNALKNGKITKEDLDKAEELERTEDNIKKGEFVDD